MTTTEMIKCPHANSEMTPCFLKDGTNALSDDGYCVGCNRKISEILIIQLECLKARIMVNFGNKNEIYEEINHIVNMLKKQ